MALRGIAADSRGRANDILMAAITFIALFFLCLLFPYTGDDWAWGSSIGIERLTTLFADYNGRYFGNILVLLLTRNAVARSVVVAAALVGISYGVYSLTGKSNKSVFVLSVLMLLLVPARMAAQGIVWTSGFSNYGMVALVLVLYANICKCTVQGNSSECGKPLVAAVVLLAFLGSLIMENITLFNVFAPVVMLLLVWVKQRRVCPLQVAYLVGSVLGAILMFTNGAYTSISQGEDGYRNVADDKVSFAIERAVTLMPYWLICNYWQLPFLVAIALAIGLMKGRSDNQKRIAHIAALVMSFILAVGCWCLSNGMLDVSEKMSNRLALVLLGLCFALIVLVAYTNRDNSLSVGIAWCMFALVVIVAPLLIVNPIGPRNFLPVYVVECCAVAMIWTRYVSTNDTFSKAVAVILVVVTVLVFAQWVNIYKDVHEVDVSRNQLVLDAVESGKSEIDIEKLPHEGYVHCPDPSEAIWEKRYKLFYNIPQDFKIRVIE